MFRLQTWQKWLNSDFFLDLIFNCCCSHSHFKAWRSCAEEHHDVTHSTRCRKVNRNILMWVHSGSRCMSKQTMGSRRMKRSKVHIAVRVLYGAPVATSGKQTSSFCSFLPNTVINIRPLPLHNNLRNQIAFADICRLRVPVYFHPECCAWLLVLLCMQVIFTLESIFF